MHTNAYVHLISEKKIAVSFKENKEVCLGGYAVRKGEGGHNIIIL